MVGDHVTLEAGTGCVHTAPGHGEDDFSIGQRYNIGVLCPIDDQGKFTNEAPGYEGIFYEKANTMITDRLQESGHLLKLSSVVHQYAHDWRTKKPVIYRATEQWFASIDKFRAQMLEEIKQVKWTPHWGELRLHNMIADRGDWCISRQRAWGVPIPIFYCRSCNHPLVNEQTIEKVASVFEAEGSNAWFLKPEKELLPEGITSSECGHDQFRKENDIMDVWFDSGSSHAAVLEARPELQWPADLYMEGSDQYRGWYNSSLITGTAVRGKSPYKSILSHGFTLDGEGKKMSKSLGNTIDPNKVCNSLGADILRLWVSSVDYQSDVRISDNILSQITEVYRKIRNTLRFLLSNLAGFDPKVDRVSLDQLDELDRFTLGQLDQMSERVLAAYESYEFHVVYQSVHHFCAVDLSALYLDIVKDRLYASSPNAVGRRAAQTVLYEALTVITRLVAPVLPHTADEIWKFAPGVEHISVQLSQMPDVKQSRYDAGLEHKWLQFIEIRDDVLKALEDARAKKLIGNALGAAIDLYVDKETIGLLSQFEQLEQLFIVSKVAVHTAVSIPADSVQFKKLAVRVSSAEGEKCERCWNVTPEVGMSKTHPTLCKRCAEVVSAHYEV
jgi:isoleucyl-tRNA synthetase